MRPHRLIMLLLCLLAATPAFSQLSTWVNQNSGTQENLNDVYFISADSGWAVGDNGTFLRTVNGGNTWTSLTSFFTVSLLSVQFTHPDTGYVLPMFGEPFYTHDGGATWNEVQFLDGICYGTKLRFNGPIAYMLYQGCFGGTWLYTWDPRTGDTTELFNYNWTPPFAIPEYRGIGFPGPGSAVAMGVDNLTGRTTDGGDNWTVTGPDDTLMDWVEVSFINANEGYAVNEDLFMPLYKTLDGGQTWSLDSAWVSTFFYPVPTDVDYRASGFGYVTAKVNWNETGVIFEQRPGQWVNYISTDHVPRSMSFVTDSVGWVVGDSGMIMKRLGGPLAVEEGNPEFVFELFPNPATGITHLRWNDLGDATITVLATDGRQVKTLHATQGQTQVDLRGMCAGMYFVRVETGAGVGTKRLVLH